MSSSVRYYEFGSIVVAIIVGLTITGDRISTGLPTPRGAVIFNARDVANGNLATLYFDNTGLRTYKAVNFTDGDPYTGTFVYAKA